MYVRMYVCMYVCMHVCMHACMHVCVYVLVHPLEARGIPMRGKGGVRGIRQNKVRESLSNYFTVTLAHTLNLALSLWYYPYPYPWPRLIHFRPGPLQSGLGPVYLRPALFIVPACLPARLPACVSAYLLA